MSEGKSQEKTCALLEGRPRLCWDLVGEFANFRGLKNVPSIHSFQVAFYLMLSILWFEN